MISLNEVQQQVVDAPLSEKIYFSGFAGCGKTTTAVERLRHWLDAGVPASQVRVIVPQRLLATPYDRAIRRTDILPGGQVDVTTSGGLALHTIDLFWAVIAEKAGFDPLLPPTFLSLESAQYVMAKLISPLIDEKGYFGAVKINRNRLFNQVIDNLNKAALNMFPHTEIGDRLKAAWLGESNQLQVFDQAQECATLFREYCIQHNLLDFSLQMELFSTYALHEPRIRTHVFAERPYLIADNVEEDSPLAHRILENYLEHSRGALIVYDEDAGFRRFLGADAIDATVLAEVCDVRVHTELSFVTPPELTAFGNELGRVLDLSNEPVTTNPLERINYDDRSRFYPQMLDTTADEIINLVTDEDVPPGEIVVMAPFLSDSLRFSLASRLEEAGVPVRSHRPSRALREEPATRSLLTFAELAHPDWGMNPSEYDVAYALMLAIGSLEVGEPLDLIRAQLLAEAAYPSLEDKSRLRPFELLPIEVQERISYILGERYDALRYWIEDYIARREALAVELASQAPKPKKRGRKKKGEVETPTAPPLPEVELDHFLSRLFGEVLSKRGFGFYADFQIADVVANLIDSARLFRQTLDGRIFLHDTKSIAQEYVEMVRDGVIANQYVRGWQIAYGGDAQSSEENAVLLVPAYTFLMLNRSAKYQFWLDVGSRGWFERLYQPLTHPYVLSLQWTLSQQEKWTDIQEDETRRETLNHLILGLLRRCSEQVYIKVSELSESGYEAQGQLWMAIQRVIRRVFGPGGMN